MPVGAVATHVAYISGCGEPDLLLEKWLGEFKAQDRYFVHVGVEPVQGKDFFATLTEADFPRDLKFLPTSLGLCAGRKEPLSLDETRMRRCKLGELR